MAKKGIVITSILVTIIIVVTIIISVINLRPATFQSVVTYASSETTPANNYYVNSNTDLNTDISFLTTLVRYNKPIKVFGFVIVIMLLFLFNTVKRRKD